MKAEGRVATGGEDEPAEDEWRANGIDAKRKLSEIRGARFVKNENALYLFNHIVIFAL